MVTWLLYGYLAVSTLTFLFVYAASVVAARADGRQAQSVTKLAVPQRPTNTMAMPVETLSLSTI